jgi:hypothetical protein
MGQRRLWPGGIRGMRPALVLAARRRRNPQPGRLRYLLILPSGLRTMTTCRIIVG